MFINFHAHPLHILWVINIFAKHCFFFPLVYNTAWHLLFLKWTIDKYHTMVMTPYIFIGIFRLFPVTRMSFKFIQMKSSTTFIKSNRCKGCISLNRSRRLIWQQYSFKSDIWTFSLALEIRNWRKYILNMIPSITDVKQLFVYEQWYASPFVQL